MLRRQSLIALAVALLLGLVAVYLANAFIVGADKQNAENGTTKVAIAALPLAYGTDVTADKIRFADYPNSAIPPGSFTSLDQLLPNGKKRVALMAIAVNEPILATKVSGEGQNASIAALLPDGMRAASVRINDVSGVSGFIQPNDSVDVLITRSGGAQNGQQITDMLLQNVHVLAIGQDAQGADGKPTLAPTATLEVDPLGAQKLALAQQIGTLSLVLRKPGEEQDSGLIQTVSLDDLRYGRMGVAPAQPQAPRTVVRRPVAQVRRPAAPRPVAPPRPTTNNVDVVRGTINNSYEVGEYDS